MHFFYARIPIAAGSGRRIDDDFGMHRRAQHMTSAAERVASALRQAGVDAQILEFPQSTRTARDAAAAVGTTVAQIVKSLVFLAGGRPVLVLGSGANRVDGAKLAAAAGVVRVAKADAELVRDVTGFAIGGVPPVGHRSTLPVYLDRDLMAFDVVYASGGTPNTVFPIAPRELARLTAATVADLREDA